MMRGTRAAILLLIALAIALGVAVQHDNFVRHWLVPPPSNELSAKKLISHVSTDGLVSIDEDFFLLVRVLGAHTKILLSDITAATDWPIARSAVEHLELPIPDDEDDQVPAGDLAIVADLGMGAMDMGALLDDYDLYPDEMLGDIASKLGFGRLYDDTVGVAAP